jgi:hypothetical protein
MDYKRLALAAVVAWFVDTIYGIIVWMRILGGEFAKYPQVFRPQEAMTANIPLMFAGGLLAMFALVYIYAKGYEGGSGIQEGFRFGLLLALFTFGFVSVGIYGSFNIGRRIAVLASIVSFIEMIMVGVVIGALYRPAAGRAPARAAAV